MSLFSISRRQFAPTRTFLLWAYALLLAGASITVVAADNTPVQDFVVSTYQLGAGDEIQIQVYGEEDLSVKTRLGDNGVINYPFLGQLKVTGQTISELEQRITDGLKGKYLVNPSVHVAVTEFRPFYINGEVKKPGGYPYQPGLSVNKAAALAGGFTERASRSKIYLIRATDPNKKPLAVDVNTPISPGDVITIEQSFF